MTLTPSISSSIQKEGIIINEDPLLDHKLDLITAGARPYLKEHLLNKISRDNCSVIINYILTMQTEINLSDSYRMDTIHKLKQLAEFHTSKNFKEMTRQDIIEFLDRLRKPESVDPLHKWVGSYELARTVLLRFFRWLYYPDITPSKKRPIPTIMQNIPKIKRKEVSCYKPTDLWTEEDDVLFYKYCPSVRDRCWHAITRDTGCRPHELLKLKIKDVILRQLEGGYQIAKITVNGKTGVRNVRLNNSYPFLKEWLSNGHHPFPSTLNAPLFCGIGKKNTGRRITIGTMQSVYENYKKRYFPKLLEDPLILEEDKRKIRDLLRKPWNLYIRRHTAATEISKRLKDSVLIDQYMGWSHAGNTRQKYQHYYSDDGIDAMLLADGIPVSSSTSFLGATKGLLKPKICPNCEESNKPDSKFCVKCKFVLSFDLFNEAIEEKAKAAKESEETKKMFEKMQDVLDKRMKEQAEKEAKELMKTDEMMKRMERMQADLDEKIRDVEKEKVFKDFLGDVATMIFDAEAPKY